MSVEAPARTTGHATDAEGRDLSVEEVVKLPSPSVEAIHLVSAGIPATYLDELAEMMGVSLEWIYSSIGLPRSTMDRKRKEGKPLSKAQSERVLELRRFIHRAEEIVEESGDPTGFDAAAWAGRWLDQPVPALGGRRPAEYMTTSDGQRLILNLLGRMQSGAYS